MLLLDLLVIAGAPGSGKTTVSDLLYTTLQSPYIDFGDVRNFHLDSQWSNQSSQEEQMSFENLFYILKNYIRYGYKNVILNDLKDFRVQQIPEKDKLLSVADVSKEAEISRQRILQIIESGDLKAELIGKSYVILQSDFETWNSSRREAGRPKKETVKE